MYRERQRLEINDVPLSENFLCETYPQYRPYSRRSKLSMTSKTSPSLLISEDTPYARGFRSRNVRASEKHLFPGLRRSARYLRNAPLCKLRGRFFLFYILSIPPSPPSPPPLPLLSETIEFMIVSRTRAGRGRRRVQAPALSNA